MIPFAGGGSGAIAIVGEQRDDQGSLFYEFRLEDRVPGDHLLRKIDRFLDLGAFASRAGDVLQLDGSPLDRALSGVAHVRPSENWKRSAVQMVDILLKGMQSKA